MIRLFITTLMLFGVLGIFTLALFSSTQAHGTTMYNEIDNSYEDSLDFDYLEGLYNEEQKIYFTEYVSETKRRSILKEGANNIPIYFVAHATGETQGITGSNSKEAFIANYEKGFRLFEMDMSITKDNHVIAFHDGVEHRIDAEGELVTNMTLEEFQSHTYVNTLTLMGVDEIIDLLSTYPDSYIITDTKDSIDTILRRLMEEIDEQAPWLKKRIIPQIYKPLDLEVALSIYDFPDIIFTLYRTDMTENNVIEFAHDSRITAVTMPWVNRYYDAYAKRIQALGLPVFVHTVNDKYDALLLNKKGVGVYTDYYYENK